MSIKIGTKHPWMYRIQACLNGGPRPFPYGDNGDIRKYFDEFYKVYSQESLCQF